MKRLSFLLIASLNLSPIIAIADDFYIEEKGLQPVSKSIDAAIRKTKDLDTSCKLIGKTINLTGQGQKNDFVVTTANACEWAASAGPLWVVRGNGKTYKVVLSYLTYTLKLRNKKNNGLYAIQTSRGTASMYEIEFWSFTGKQYKKSKAYIFAADDKKTCKAHKDICPWQF